VTEPAEFLWPARVYYEDTDAAGVVYHANYLNFMERARTEWLRALGFEQDRLRREEQCLFVVRSVLVRFLSPARFNDALLITARVVRLGGASIDFLQEVRRDGETLCSAEIKLALLDADSLRPKPIPRPLKALIGAQLS